MRRLSNFQDDGNKIKSLGMENRNLIQSLKLSTFIHVKKRNVARVQTVRLRQESLTCIKCELFKRAVLHTTT
jgi:hypothetical protein